MKLFFSAGEPSGDVHTASLIRALRSARGDLELTGFGGGHMEQAGCRPLLYPLADHPVMGFLRVAGQIGRFLNLASLADRHFHQHRPDAVILVDCPGFNWWIARRAHFHRIPVFYFLPPQIWAWATWRVSKMRRWVDHVLCSFPFEVDWYHARHVPAILTGHPYFDELGAQRPDPAFLSEYADTPDAPVVGILPGSRTLEVTRIFPMYLRAAKRVAHEFPRARFPVACLREEHVRIVRRQLRGTRLDVRPYLDRTAEIIRASRVCMSKSGSVSLELLYHGRPSTILYQVSRSDYAIGQIGRRLGLVATPYITLVNILAGRELLPEYVSATDISERLSGHVLDWLRSPERHAETVAQLRALKERVAEPGAARRASRYILETLGALPHARAA